MNNFEVLIPIAFFTALVIAIRVISDNRLRHKLIEKNLVDENTKYLYTQSVLENPMPALKWGMLLIAVGLAIVLNVVFPFSISEQLTIGLMFLFGGVAYIIYYFLLKRNRAGNVE